MLSHYVSDMTVRTALRVIFDPQRLLTMLDISNIAWLYARNIEHSDMSPLQRNQSYAETTASDSMQWPSSLVGARNKGGAKNLTRGC
jgi:hypothetical protein